MQTNTTTEVLNYKPLNKNKTKDKSKTNVKTQKIRNLSISHTKRNVLIGVVALAVLLVGIYFWGLNYFQDKFLPNTYISGVNVSSMTLDQAVSDLTDIAANRKVKVIGRDGVTSVINAQDVGLVLSDSPQIEEAFYQRDVASWPKNLLIAFATYVQPQSNLDSQTLNNAVNALEVVAGPQVIPTENARAVYDGQKYIVKEEVYGTQVDPQKLLDLTTTSLINGKDVVNLESTGTYVVPTVLSDNPTLAQSINQLNSTLLNTQIIYSFPPNQEVLDRNTFANWFTTDANGNVALDQNQVAAYVASLAQKYDTVDKPINFTTSAGEHITFENYYNGWEIDQEAEVAELSNLLLTGQSTTREPVYSETGTNRALGDTITGTYLEISIGDQNMWYYKDGNLLVDTPIVTGNPYGGNGTPTGYYTLQYKDTSVTLTGPNGDGTNYESYVNFWMPFNGGIGVHDASWRSSFGGSIYLGGGSHGCVNTPYSAVKSIYENIEVDCPVLVY